MVAKAAWLAAAALLAGPASALVGPGRPLLPARALCGRAGGWASALPAPPARCTPARSRVRLCGGKSRWGYGTKEYWDDMYRGAHLC